MKPELAILSGLQASGKSSLCRQYFPTHVHISKDAWPNGRNKEHRQRAALRAALQQGKSIVIDNTNPTPADRAPLIEIGRELGAVIASYHLIVDFAEASKRNAQREGRARVPEVALKRTAKVLIAPTIAEGFDQLFEVRSLETGFHIKCKAAAS